MINKIKRLYPKHNIYIRKDDYIVDINDKKVDEDTLEKNVPYVLINDSYYEVHKKIKSKR